MKYTKNSTSSIYACNAESLIKNNLLKSKFQYNGTSVPALPSLKAITTDVKQVWIDVMFIFFGREVTATKLATGNK